MVKGDRDAEVSAGTARGEGARGARDPKTLEKRVGTVFAAGGQSGRGTYRTDVHELAGADVVGVHEEGSLM